MSGMAWIEQVPDDRAEGLLAEIFAAARMRAGRVFNILRIQSLNPRTLQTSLELYLRTMHAASPVPRRLREMIAVVVSATNECHY